MTKPKPALQRLLDSRDGTSIVVDDYAKLELRALSYFSDPQYAYQLSKREEKKLEDAKEILVQEIANADNDLDIRLSDELKNALHSFKVLDATIEYAHYKINELTTQLDLVTSEYEAAMVGEDPDGENHD